MLLMFVREGLGANFVHHNNVDPETGGANFKDVTDLVERFTFAFEVNEAGDRFTIALFHVDNSKGASDANVNLLQS